MGHKVKRCQQPQCGEKSYDSKVRVIDYSRSSMPQADEAGCGLGGRGGRTHCNLPSDTAPDYLVTGTGDVTDVTENRSRSLPGAVLHDKAGVQFLDRPGRREAAGRHHLDRRALKLIQIMPAIKSAQPSIALTKSRQ